MTRGSGRENDPGSGYSMAGARTDWLEPSGEDLRRSSMSSGVGRVAFVGPGSSGPSSWSGGGRGAVPRGTPSSPSVDGSADSASAMWVTTSSVPEALSGESAASKSRRCSKIARPRPVRSGAPSTASHPRWPAMPGSRTISTSSPTSCVPASGGISRLLALLRQGRSASRQEDLLTGEMGIELSGRRAGEARIVSLFPSFVVVARTPAPQPAISTACAHCVGRARSQGAWPRTRRRDHRAKGCGVLGQGRTTEPRAASPAAGRDPLFEIVGVPGYEKPRCRAAVSPLPRPLRRSRQSSLPRTSGGGPVRFIGSRPRTHLDAALVATFDHTPQQWSMAHVERGARGTGPPLVALLGQRWRTSSGLGIALWGTRAQLAQTRSPAWGPCAGDAVDRWPWRCRGSGTRCGTGP